LYATILGEQTGPTVTLRSLKPATGMKIRLLGYDKPLVWSQEGEDVKVALPAKVPGKYAYVLSIGQPGST
jgi:hypothetical protein